MEYVSREMKMFATSEFTSTQKKMALISDADKAKLDEWYKWAEDNYDKGGHWVVESYEPWELLTACTTLDEVKELCGLLTERCEDAQNA